MFIEMDTSSKPERNLLAQVVLLCLNDACQTPIKDGKHVRLGKNSFTAMRFLFDTRVAGLNEYALWLGFDADQARTRLLRLIADQGPNKIGDFDSMQRRNFRINYKLWKNMRDLDQYGLDIMDDDDDNDHA